MKQIHLLVIFFLILTCEVIFAQSTITSAQTGNWADGTTWVGGVVPTVNDDVVIAAGHTVTLPPSPNWKSAAGKNISINGTMIVNGITTASALSYNFGDITINNGGKLTFPFVSGAWSSNKFVASVITIKNGGSLENSTTSNYWSAASSLVLENGGTYKSISTTTNFPATITLNEGTVWYAKSTAGDQTVKAMTYKNLKISDTGCNKLISSAISVNGTLFLTSGTLASGTNLTMGNGATIERDGGLVTGTLSFAGNTRVKYTGTGSITTGSELPATVRFLQVYIGTGNILSLNTPVTVADTLTLSSGVLNNSANQVSINNQALIRRASGSLAASPNFLGDVNIDYISNSVTVTTGFEIPSSTSALINLSVTGNKGVTLGSDVTANGNVTISGSNLITDANKLILGSASLLTESNGKLVFGNLDCTRNLSKNVNETFGGIGIEIKAKGADPGITQVIRENVAAINGTLRIYKINPATNNNLDADIKFVYNESELNGVVESGLGVYNSTDNGINWIRVGSKANEAGNYAVSEKINSLGWLSANTEGLAVPVIKDADEINDNSFKVNWETVPGATGYRIDVSLNSAFSSYVTNYNDTDAGNGTAKSITGLTGGTTYYYRLRSVDANGYSAFTETKTVTLTSSAPIAVNASDIKENEFKANWNELAGAATGYSVDVSRNDTFTDLVAGYNNADAGNTSNVTSLVVTGLEAGKTYYYRVKAKNNSTVNSNIITVITLPVAPVTNDATNFTQTSFKISWSSVTGTNGYKVDISKVNNFSGFVAGYENKDVLNVSEFNITGLENGTTYYYRVKAYNSSGNGNPSEVKGTVTIPANPVSAEATNIASVTFTANWNSSGGATNYYLDVAEDLAFNSLVTNYNNKDVVLATAENVTGLIAGKTYYYRVRAGNAGGLSGYSATVTVNMESLTTIASGNWSNPAIWSSGSLPRNIDAVKIAAGHVVTIDNSSAECGNISFGDINSKLSFASGSVLSVYGNFTILANHTAFLGWSTGSKLIFTGNSATQLLSGWESSTTVKTSLMEVVVDKSAGKVVTAGNNMKLGLGTSLEIINGTFELGQEDDIQGCTIDGSAGTQPTVLVNSGAVLNIAGGGTYIRSRSFTGDETSKIGKLTVYGTANLAAGSDNSRRVNFNGIDIENGGIVEFATGKSTSTGAFNPGTIQIKSGGVFKNNLSTNFWFVNVTNPNKLKIDDNGMVIINSSATAVPQVVENNGTVIYSYQGNQVLPAGITSYKNITFAGRGNKTLGSNIAVSGSLSILEGTVAEATQLVSGGFGITYSPSATLEYASTIAQTTTDVEWGNGNTSQNIKINNTAGVTLNSAKVLDGTLYLTAGELKNDVYGLTINDNSTIKRTNGTFAVAPVFENKVNIEYLNSAPLNSSFEIPDAQTSLNNFTVNGNGTVTLSKDIYVNGQAKIQTAQVITNANKVILNGTGSISESPGKTISGNLYAERILSQNTNETFGGIGVEIKAKGAAPGLTKITRINNTNANGSKRKFEIISAVNSNLDAEVKFNYDESELLIAETGLGIFNSNDNGTSWKQLGSKVYADNNYIKAEKVNDLSVLSIKTEVLEAPVAKISTNVTDNSFTANWNATSGTVGYRIDVASNATFSNYVSGFNDKDAGNDLNINVNGLSAGASYYYRIRSYDNQGYSNFSEVKMVTLAPSVPTLKEASYITENSFIIEWNEIQGAAGYYIEIAFDNNFAKYVDGFNNLPVVSNADKYLVPGLKGGNVYYCRIRAYNTNGISNYSNIIRVSTKTNTAPVISYIQDQEMMEEGELEVKIDVKDPNGNECQINVLPSNNKIKGSYLNGIIKLLATKDFTGEVIVVVEASDGYETTSTVFKLLVKPVNDNPVLSNIEKELIFYQDKGKSINMTNSLKVNDVDGDSLASAIVKLSGDYLKNEDIVEWQDNNKISGQFDYERAELSFTGKAAVAEYESLLRSISYKSNGSTRNIDKVIEVSYSVSDGQLQSNVMSRMIRIILQENVRPPKEVTFKTDQTGNLVFKWKNDSENSEGFIISRSKIKTLSKIIEETVLIDTVYKGTTEFKDNKVKEGYTYKYKLKAFAKETGITSQEIEIGDLFIPLRVPSELYFMNTTIGEIELHWKDNSESEENFVIERQDSANGDFIEIGTSEKNITFFIDKLAQNNVNYIYRVKARCGKHCSKYSNRIEAQANLVAVDNETGIPDNYILNQNYPNPFNPSTTISYGIPQSEKVIIQIYDILGNEVKVLVNEENSAGYHTINLNMSGYASGIYLVRMQAGSFSQIKKIVLIK